MIPRVRKPWNWSRMAFNEKIAHYGTQMTAAHAQYVDKLNVKKLVGDLVKTARVVKVLESIDDLTEEDINADHIIKGAHGCKFNVNLTDGMCVEDVKQKLRSFNRVHDPYRREKQYGHIQPRFFIEEKIDDFWSGKNGHAAVFMIRCIDSRPVSIGIIIGEDMNNYEIDWRPIKIEMPFLNVDEVYNEVGRMIELASELSKPFEFVRMDFYLDRNRDIYLSEFTFTPSGGRQVYQSRAIEMRLGASWR